MQKNGKKGILNKGSYLKIDMALMDNSQFMNISIPNANRRKDKERPRQESRDL